MGIYKKNNKTVQNSINRELKPSINTNYHNPDFSVFDNLVNPIIIVSENFFIQYMNVSAKKYFNEDRENFLNNKCYDYFSCVHKNNWKDCLIYDIHKTGMPHDISKTAKTCLRDDNVRVSLLKEEYEGMKHAVLEIFHTDSNVYNMIDDGINSVFMEIVQLADVGIFMFGEDFKITFANNAAAELLGLPMDKICGTDFREFLNNKKAVLFIEAITREIKDYNTVSCYSESHFIFGKENLNAVEMCIAKSGVKKFEYNLYVYLRNITKEIKLQDDFKQTNVFLKSLINSSADCIIASDIKGKIIIFNEAAEKLLGYTAEEAKNNIHISKIYKPGHAREVMMMLRSNDYGGVGKMETSESIIVDKDGNEIPSNLSASIIYDKNGDEVASMGIFYDLRGKKKMQKELEDIQMKLFQSEKMSSLGKLAAGIAHEINNPLGGIMIYTDLLLEELGSDNEKGEDLKRIASEAKRCKNIVKGLLEFSRQTGNMMSNVDINELLEQGLHLFENQPVFYNIKIIRDYDNTLPFVKCDSARLKQVFINLTQNAIDAMNEKGVFTIKTRFDGKKTEIIFSDTGTGIPDDIKQKIFDPFFTTKEVGKGTGLGLSMSYGIIKDHGGTINVKSEIGVGTSFIIELPIH